MKVSKPVAFVLTIAVVAVLGTVIFRGTPPATTFAANLEVTPPGVPTDRAPERYSGSFLDTTEAAMLRRLNVTIYPEDKVYAFPDPSLGVGSSLLVYRAQQVQISDAQKVTTIRTWAKTVADVVNDQNLDLGNSDHITPALDTVLPIQATPVAITITRVAESQLVLSTSVPYTTQYKDDATLNKGTNVTDQAGKNGTLTKTYLVRRENGVEVSRILQKSEQTTDPVAQVIRSGTKLVITSRCAYTDQVASAAAANNIDPNALCYRMMAESNGHATSNNSNSYEGLFQYDPGFWSSVSAKAGYAGASIWDPTAQINVTAWAWAHGYRGRWPTP